MNEPIGKQLLDAMKGYVARTVAPLAARIETWEQKVADIPAGPPGPIGPEGRKGDDGLNGKDAEIHPDTIALLVMTEVQKEVQKAISAIPKAKDGLDASQIPFISSIDESKSYPKGVCAPYRGGEIRSTRQTDPFTEDLEACGWAVIRDGIAAIVVTQSEDNPREFTIAAMQTSGTKTITQAYIPVPLFKDIWREGEYQQGDIVQRDGSGWIATKATTTQPGQSNSDWKLFIKRGRDGKDGVLKPPEPPKPVRLGGAAS